KHLATPAQSSRSSLQYKKPPRICERICKTSNNYDKTTGTGKNSLGIEINSQNNRHHPFLQAFEDVSRLLAKRVVSPWLYLDFIYGLIPEGKKVAYCRKVAYEFVDNIVRLKREELATLKSNNEPVENKTFLDMIIDSSSKIKGYSDVEVREEVIVIMSAGSDTSAVGTGYTAVMLSRYPEVQEKVYQELEEVFGNNSRPVTAADLPKLVYLEAVVKETLRLYPPVPIYVRETHSDCKLPNGLTVPKGVALLFLLHGMHRNPKYWGDDAEQFRPERFFEGSLRHPVQFIPFSYSVRNCLEHSRSANSCTTESLNEIITSDAETGIKYRRLQNKLKEMLVSKPRSKESYLSKETLELLDERRTLISNKGDKERRQKIANLSKEIKENMRRDRKEKIHRVLEENIKRTGGTKKAMKQLSKHGKEWISKQKQSESYLTNRLSIQKLATEYYRLLYSDKFDLGLATIPEVNESKENKVDEVPEILASEATSAFHYYLMAKVSELLDTVFFVLRKKKTQITFLHVYHHTLMVAATWGMLKYNPTYVIILIGTINSFVHILMYAYYGLSAFPSLDKYLWWKKYLTAFQLIQFGIMIVHAAVATAVSECTPSYILLFTIFFNVLLMIYLFSDFYLKSYVKKEDNIQVKNNLKQFLLGILGTLEVRRKDVLLKTSCRTLHEECDSVEMVAQPKCVCTFHLERENLMNLFKKAARIANDQGGLSSFWLGPKLYIESALGVKMNSQQNSDHRFMKAFEKVSHLVARRIVTVWMHPDVIYKNLPIYKEFKESRRVLFDFVDKLIQNKREELKNNNNQLYDQNWMNLFKKAARIANNQGGLSSFWMGPKLYIVVTDPETVDVVLKSCMDKDDTTMRYCRTLTGNGSIFAAGGRRTFLEMMIMGSGGERGYTDLELREEVLVIILAGTDTSAVGASYASVLLSRFPNVQEKVYEELQDVFGDSDRPLTVQDLPNLKYLDAVMKETLRMYPPVPVTVREVHNDVVLPSGVTLVDGVSIFNNIWGIHRNPKYWGADADVFRPERFLDGYNYAMMSMKTVIANLVRAYKVLPPKDMNPAQLKEPLRLTKYVFYRIDSIPIWRPRRKILAPTFSMKNLNQFVEIFAQQSNLMTELLRPVAGKGDFSIWKYMNTYSFDSVCESALGVQMNSQQNSDHRFMKAFEKVSHLIARRIVSIWMHPDVIYKSLPIYKVFKENRRVLSFKLSVKN
ncbi:hypothetical protein MSG28_007447, partial [Choristoneura fumiferana]